MHGGGNKKKTHQCDYCPKKFHNPSGKTKHEDNMHRNIRKLKCDVCDWSTNSKTCLKTHKQSIHEGIMYNCNQPGCAKSYNLKRNLDAHKWTSHKIPLPKAKIKKLATTV